MFGEHNPLGLARAQWWTERAMEKKAVEELLVVPYLPAPRPWSIELKITAVHLQGAYPFASDSFT